MLTANFVDCYNVHHPLMSRQKMHTWHHLCHCNIHVSLTNVLPTQLPFLSTNTMDLLVMCRTWDALGGKFMRVTHLVLWRRDVSCPFTPTHTNRDFWMVNVASWQSEKLGVILQTSDDEGLDRNLINHPSPQKRKKRKEIESFYKVWV